MKWFTYYVMRPKPELLERGKSWADEIRGALSFPILFRKWEGDYRVWSPDDHAIEVKLLALLEMWNLLPSPEMLEQVLPGAKMDVQTFDRWWMLERIGNMRNVHDIEEEIPEALVGTVQPTGNARVDQWLERMKTMPPGKRIYPRPPDSDDE